MGVWVWRVRVRVERCVCARVSVYMCVVGVSGCEMCVHVCGVCVGVERCEMCVRVYGCGMCV